MARRARGGKGRVGFGRAGAPRTGRRVAGARGGSGGKRCDGPRGTMRRRFGKRARECSTRAAPSDVPAVRLLYGNAYRRVLPRLNPAQHRLLTRHVDRAIEALEEADRLLRGLVTAQAAKAIAEIRAAFGSIDREEVALASFKLDELPLHLVPYLENPFAQGLAFNHYCAKNDLSHTKAMKDWPGGNGAVNARNLVFLPPVYLDLWESGALDKTRLVNIANRNLTDEGYADLAEMVRTRRKEDVDDRLLKVPGKYLNTGRRGPEQALEAARTHGWAQRFATVEINESLVHEADAGRNGSGEPAVQTPAEQALRNLRAGLGGAKVAPEVEEALSMSPDPQALAERFLKAHKQAGDADPDVVTKTLFFAHAGPMQRLVADDKLLLRHFRPVKTQKRGQLFYRILEAIEEALLERSHEEAPEARGVSEAAAIEAVRGVIVDLNKDPNRFLVLPDEWLGEVTRRHLYFGSRTRKEGAAYKWFRKIGNEYFLGGHKTRDEAAEREARRSAQASN
jgi:hypothetical protein